MKQSKFTEEQIHKAIQQVEAGRKAEEVVRDIVVSKHTLYAWRAKYGGLAKDDLKKVKQAFMESDGHISVVEYAKKPHRKQNRKDK